MISFAQRRLRMLLKLRAHLGSKRRLAVFALVALLGASLAIADSKPAMRKLKAGSFTLAATPITTFGRGGISASTGKLLWRGGLVLQSAHKNFGGWSGLFVEPDGRRFLAISDAGAWMSGDITYEGVTPRGVEKPRIGPLLALDGKNLKRGRDRDAEALSLISGSLDRANILVAFEQNARIASYEFSLATGASPTRGFVEMSDVRQRLPGNGGVEAMTVLKGGPHAGAIVAYAEDTRDEEGNVVGWVLAKSGVMPIKLKNNGGFAISDVTSLEDGSLIVLERRFSWLDGLYIRVRMVPAKSVGHPTAIAGETLLEADLAQEIDNMEGIALSRDANGTAVLTLISDDNFNRTLQRTILLQFAYPDDPAKPLARPVTAKARP